MKNINSSYSKYNIMDMIVGVLFILLIVVGLIYFSPYEIGVATGESMQPTYNNFAITIYDTSQTEVNDFEEGDIIVFKYSDKQIMHRVVEKDDDGILIKGDNPKSTTHYIPKNYENANIQSITHHKSIYVDIYGKQKYTIFSH